MTDYRTVDAHGLVDWLAARPSLSRRLGGTSTDWHVREVSDGNLNNVFIVEGPAGAVCCKQSLPHVRVDPSWKMPLTRTDFEAAYMRAVTPHVGHLIPALLDFDPAMHLLAMESLTHHKVLRHALEDGSAQAGFSSRVGAFVGRTGFETSWRARPFEAAMADLAAFSTNTTLTRITVDLVLTDPFRAASPRNHWMSPELDTAVTTLQGDRAVQRAVTHLQERFLSAPQALLHGDLHTGSIMVQGDDLRVIDGEFSLMGPIGFDAGLYIGNLLLHAAALPDRQDWMLDEIRLFWRALDHEFRAVWDAHPVGGDVGALLAPQDRHRIQTTALHEIMRDSAGFAGAEMIRRTIGYAQVSDFALAGDRVREAEARHRALEIGRHLIVQSTRLDTLGALIEAARR